MQSVGSVTHPRSRGRPRKGNNNKVILCLTAVLVVLFVITWIIITQKTTQKLNDIADATAEARNLGLMGVPGKKTKAVGGTSLVECVVSTASATSGANGVLTITVRHDLSPLASAVFIDLVQAHWFDGVFLFRVLKGFIAQWGIRHKELEEQHHKIPKTKDEVTPQTLSNIRGTLSFAGGAPVSKQVFVNLKDNRQLDKENSHPFAQVDEAGMKVLEQLYMDYKDGQGQVKALSKGLEAIQEEFPHWSKIEKCQVLSEYEPTEADKKKTQ